MRFLDENNILINHNLVEKTEQDHANKFIKPNSVVLELGARYGTVSCIINKKLNNPNNQVSVEPDEKVWNALETNMNLNNCKFNILKGVISNKPVELSGKNYATTSNIVESSSIKNYSLEDVETLYNLKFNTLVADCEGFLEIFLDENPKLYDQITLFMFEKDFPQKCNYQKIMNILKSKGFTNSISGFHEVWEKIPTPLSSRLVFKNGRFTRKPF